MQFWTDVRHLDRWRIQRNAVTGHFRLLDAANRRRASGTVEQCIERLEAARIDEDLRPFDGNVVVLLHGLGRSSSAMNPIAKYLSAHTDFQLVNFSYASTRASLSGHATALQMVVDNLQDARQINFVGHSLGNMVVRRFLRMRKDSSSAVHPAFHAAFNPGRMVMIGPPSNGAELARMLNTLSLFKLILGRSGVELGNAQQLSVQLATPEFEFGIIAGNGGPLTNPFLEGENDLVVSTKEARLPGATDFRTVDGVHTLLVNQKNVHEMTASFLLHGFFTSEQEKTPIESVDDANTNGVDGVATNGVDEESRS